MRDKSELLSKKLSGFGLKAFEYGKGWIAFGRRGKFYFVDYWPEDDFTTLEDLIANAVAIDAEAEARVREKRTEHRLMDSCRKPVDQDCMIPIRLRWEQEKALGRWQKQAPVDKAP